MANISLFSSFYVSEIAARSEKQGKIDLIVIVNVR